MSDRLYQYMLKDYQNTTYEERCNLHVEHECVACKLRRDCYYQKELPEDIYKPIESDKAWIPARKICKHFYLT
jgi:hypothetical protein